MTTTLPPIHVTWNKARAKEDLVRARQQVRELEILRHALGLDHLGLNKQGGTEGYRNYYALFPTSDGFDFCMSMCAGLDAGQLPLMGHTKVDLLAKDMVYFHVTIGGADFVKRHTGLNHLMN